MLIKKTILLYARIVFMTFAQRVPGLIPGSLSKDQNH